MTMADKSGTGGEEAGVPWESPSAEVCTNLSCEMTEAKSKTHLLDIVSRNVSDLAVLVLTLY